MSNRFATRIGLPSAEERPADAFDLVAFHEPAVGASARTKGSLYLLAQLTGGSASLAKATREALDAIQRDYYYDLSAGVLVSLGRALSGANRRLYHGRKRLGIPRRSGVSIVAVVIRAREAHVAKLGPASAVIVRDGRMYEVPPPPAVTEEDPRIRRRRVAATLGEALEVEPYRWQGALATDDRIALISRHFAHTVGVDELKAALATMRPGQAVEHLQQVFTIRGGTGSDGILAVEVTDLASTATTHQLEPVRPAEPFAGLPDQSPVPLADAIGRGLHRAGDAVGAARGALGRARPGLAGILMAFVPRRRPEFPRRISRTADIRDGRRRRAGLLSMAAVAALVAVGGTVAGVPPRARRTPSRVPRSPESRSRMRPACSRPSTSGWPEPTSSTATRRRRASICRRRAWRSTGRWPRASRRASSACCAPASIGSLDALYRVTRIAAPAVVVDLAAALDDVEPLDMVAASDGTLWVLEAGRGRVVRVDPAAGTATVVYRAGQALPSGDLPGDPWLIATAATDVVLIDRARAAWRIDLAELVPRRMTLSGVGRHQPADDPRRGPAASAAARDLQPVRGRRREWRDPALDAPGGHPGRVPRSRRAVPQRHP